jgi:hypothetical protein
VTTHVFPRLGGPGLTLLLLEGLVPPAHRTHSIAQRTESGYWTLDSAFAVWSFCSAAKPDCEGNGASARQVETPITTVQYIMVGLDGGRPLQQVRKGLPLPMVRHTLHSAGPLLLRERTK